MWITESLWLRSTLQIQINSVSHVITPISSPCGPETTKENQTNMKKPVKKTMKCSVCGRKFVTQEGLGKHLMRHVTRELFAYVDAHPNEGISLSA
jgi:ribosomal protein S14